MRFRSVLGLLLSAAVAASCGGGGGNSTSGGSTNTVTGPTPPAMTITDVAPSIGQAVAAGIHAALQAGTASARADRGLDPLQLIVRLLTPVTLHAQSFAANCSRGGNVNIRYTGLRPVVMTGTEAVFSRCGNSFRNGDVFFSGTIRLGGYWTAGDPGPVTATGTVEVEQVGAALLNGSVTGQQYNGTVAGVTVGTPDTAPPPSPNTCPGGPLSAIQVPSGGGTYSITMSVGSTCPWSVTSGPSWVNVTTGTGRGTAAVRFTVPANGGEARTGTLVVNNQNVTISQAAAGSTTHGADAAVGQWSGEATATLPCSSTPTGRFTWTGRITRSGDTFSMQWRDSYFGTTMTRSFPVAETFAFVVADEFESIRLSGRFSSDWQRIEGTLTGSIECNRQVVTATGTWQGRRTGS